MPAPLNVDWSGLRAASVAVGIREACRQATADLPPDEAKRFTERAMKRCSREKWLTQAAEAKQVAVSASPQTLSANVRTGADSVANTLKERENHTKLGLSMFTARAARVAAKLPKEKLLKSANEVKAVADIAGKVWPQEAGKGSQVSINLLIQ